MWTCCNRSTRLTYLLAHQVRMRPHFRATTRIPSGCLLCRCLWCTFSARCAANLRYLFLLLLLLLLLLLRGTSHTEDTLRLQRIYQGCRRLT
jgi:hypothetical protein